MAIATTPSCWTALARELDPDYDVTHGPTRPLPTADSDGRQSKATAPEAMAADLKGFIEALGLEQPVCAGHSMGASQVFPGGLQIS